MNGEQPEVFVRQHEAAGGFPMSDLIGCDDWPQSVVDACAELMQVFGFSAGVMDQYKMPPWIN
jgi:hypothetical protein